MIKLSKSFVDFNEENAVIDVLRSRYFGMGRQVQEFEKAIKNFIGNQNNEVVCVNTGTSALHISLLGLEIGAGDEVLVPSITYVASFQAISATGAKPVACDINPSTLYIDVNDAKKRVTKNTKAIMPVHYASSLDGIKDVYVFANEHGLRVIEDAAHAFGSVYDNEVSGYNGDIVCFSFDGIKNITCGEGGAVVSGDKEFINRIKDIRLLGVEKDTDARFNGLRSWDFDVSLQGFRYHMSNLNAAIGIEQLKKIYMFAQKRRDIAHNYKMLLKGNKNVSLFDFDYDNIVPHIFVIKARQRDELMAFLKSDNIECGIHYKPNHLLTKYKTQYNLINAENLYKDVLTLPCHYEITREDQKYIADKIAEFYNAK